jgi:hypothetical protein
MTRVAGVWIGLGLGDASEEIRAIKGFMRHKFASYAGGLADTSLYDMPMVDAVTEMQRRYAGKIGEHVPGVINVETKYAMGWLERPRQPKPVVFTVEGHLSSMWVGPCAETARYLESEGTCRWQPVGYDNVSLPFKNQTGINELKRLLGDRTLLPVGTPWAMCIFSQGGIVGSEVWMREVVPKTGSLHWRLQDWRGTLAFGNPYREKDVIAEWVTDPPKPGTQGISHTRLENTPVAWKEVSRRGDLYAENPANSQASEFRTAIYLAVQNKWSGHPDSLLNQLVEVAQRPVPEVIAMIQAISSGVMFLGNMQAHGGYDLRPCIDFLRQRL